MFWKLQEYVLDSSDLDKLVTFIRKTKRFTQFTKVKEFENAFAAWQGCKYCVFVNSGSSANLLLVNAVKELRGWKNGDEIIVPALTWPTTVTPVIQLGLKPVFIDANLYNLSFEYEKLEKKISSKTRGIFVAHLLGFPAKINELRRIIFNKKIDILEDCCESQGASWNGKKVGNFGLGSTFSFYWGHHMTTVEGGMVCSNDEELYKILLLKRSHGLARELPAKYHVSIQQKYPDIDFRFLFLTDGFNFRNSEFNAVLGISQLGKIDEFISIRNHNYAEFKKMCEQYPEELITLESKGVSSFVLPFLFRKLQRKEAFQRRITKAGIESRPLIGGNLLRQPFLAQYYLPRKFQNADFLHTNAFYIGNNQFVNGKRLRVLKKIMEQFFKKQ